MFNIANLNYSKCALSQMHLPTQVAKNMGPIWLPSGQNSPTIWLPYGLPIWDPDGQTWAPDGAQMPHLVSIFHLHHGAHLGPIWVSPYGAIWDPYGTHMGPTYTIWDPYGTHMVSMYSIYGTHMGPIWAPYWYVRAKWNLWAKKLEHFSIMYALYSQIRHR